MATHDENPAATEKINKTQTLITLRSSDCHEFSISKPAAVLSITINKMLEDDWPDGSVIPLLNVDSKTLAAVITYLNAHADDDGDADKKKNFDREFVSDKEIGVLFEVVSAANYLNIPGLMDLVCQSIADRVKNKSVEWVRKAFGIKNDFTAEEEAEIKSQNAWSFEGVEPDNDG